MKRTISMFLAVAMALCATTLIQTGSEAATPCNPAVAACGN